ncbi:MULTISPECIES: endonuclease/exonuclease/phosphatase family protein [Bacteroides]|jgi:predicted extracellular nuclease|uniref:endonuclease/exonuclease/phosphatase family protein n=1 Tax=Bacteroides TaxID=816 RepID=UPI000E4E2521|nr:MULTISPECIES: endonuclease/exonuclease/phosphatase family protein [Bacteroides]RHL10332.1 endonuclease [Bacteroides sp. AF39-11AC]
MNIKLYITFSFLFAPFFFLCGQTKKDTLSLRVVSYNVENLFDCRHDTLKNDYEFLPDAVRHWNYTKYKKKLDNIARTITAVGGWIPPALVALCEVENDSVLRDLTRRSVLREAGYRYVMTNSPDQRGIDVALLYQRDRFKLISYQGISIPHISGKTKFRPTRDILHVCGMLLNHDTLDVFVVHLPSRSGGAKESEPYRLHAARQLKAAADSVYLHRYHPQILIMGDFNDYPDNASVSKIVSAKAPPQDKSSLQPQRFYHLLARKAATQKDFGSYKYQGEWGLLDHIIVSGTLLQPDADFCTSESKADIFRPSFLLTDDKKYGGVQPFRTYYGMKYQNGYSDHLPAWADFRLIY